MTQDGNYPTSDTALAAFLVTQGYFLLSVDYSSPRYQFLFRDSESVRAAANNYLAGNALTDPSHYSRIFKKLNRIIAKRCQWEDD